MGDCRIRILIAQDLLSPPTRSSNNIGNDDTTASHNTNNQPWNEALNKLFSSDTTIREVCNAAGTLMPLLEQGEVSLWDCTTHPPKDITDWPLQKYSDIQGLQSKTLFDAGWFPSGTLRVSLKTEGAPMAAVSSLQNDEAQFNLRSKVSVDASSGGGATPSVQLVGTNTTAAPLLPSQLLQSVTQRFEDDDIIMADAQPDAALKAIQERRHNQQARAAREQERFQKLEAHIQRLDSSTKKNKTVSDQVRRMLIKSRATGAKTLKQQDRVYFHIVMDHGDTTGTTSETMDAPAATTTAAADSAKEAFCYFSRQDTMGRGILSNFTDPQGSSSGNTTRQSELLVRQTASKEGVDTIIYRRLPNVMRVYEAIELQYLEPEVNKVVLRWYNPSSEEPTTSVGEDKETRNDLDISKNGAQEQASAINQPDNSTTTDKAATTSTAGEEVTAAAQPSGDESTIEDPTLAALLRQHDEEEQKKSKKKSSKSSTSAKVRQMLMKSKAKGDAKRLQMEERFFFELITAVSMTSNENGFCETSLAYLGKQDPLGRILRDCVKPSLSANNKADGDFELLVPIQHGTQADASDMFQRLSNLSMTFQEEEVGNLFQPFGRLVIRFRSS